MVFIEFILNKTSSLYKTQFFRDIEIWIDKLWICFPNTGCHGLAGSGYENLIFLYFYAFSSLDDEDFKAMEKFIVELMNRLLNNMIHQPV